MASEKILLVALAVVFLFGLIQADLVEQDPGDPYAPYGPKRPCGPWSKCSKPCGGGTQSRKCYYHHVTPYYRHPYPVTQTRHCNTHCCPVNGGWSHWSKWSACNAYCLQYRKRSCTNPKPKCGGKQCVGVNSQKRKCRPYCKPVYKADAEADAGGYRGGYGGGYYGGGRHYGGKGYYGGRAYDADAEADAGGYRGGYGGGYYGGGRHYGGKGYYGGRAYDADAEADANPGDPYTPYGPHRPCGPWSKCSKPCGGGTQSRKCYYHHVAPYYRHPYPVTQTRHCNTHCCPVNGGWTDWSKWSACNAYCLQYRKRSCTNPKPKCGGKKCVGVNSQKRKCHRPYCKPVYKADAEADAGGYRGGYGGGYYGGGRHYGGKGHYGGRGRKYYG